MTNANNIDRLRRNDARMESIQLQVQTGSDTSAIVNALSQSTKVKKVAVSFFQLYTSPFLNPTSNDNSNPPHNGTSRKRSRSEATPQEEPSLMESIGALPRLQELTCSGGLSMHPLPASSLASLLQEASQLETLELSRIQVQGCPREFDALANALRAHTCLRSFSLNDCKLVYNNPVNRVTARKLLTPPFALDAMLKALASLPCLESVRVTTKDSFAMGILSPEAVQVLCCSHSLQSLVLQGFAWNAQHIVAMGPGVATSSTLKHLVVPKYNGMATPKVLDCLLCMLQNNTCLEQFEMRALPAGSSRSPWIDAATQILHTNTQLQVLTLGEEYNTNSTANDSIQFHLKLNQAGRSQLLSGAKSTNRDWVDAMAMVANDLDCMFWLLSQNPSLCEWITKVIDK